MEPPAGFQHPAQFGQRAGGVVDILDHLHRDGGVEHSIGVVERPDITDHRLDRRNFGAFPRRRRDLIGRDVDACRQPMRSQRQPDLAQQQPGPAANLDHPLAAPGGKFLQHGMPPRCHFVAGGEALLDSGDFAGEIHGWGYRRGRQVCASRFINRQWNIPPPASLPTMKRQSGSRVGNVGGTGLERAVARCLGRAMARHLAFVV
jgi:hypothetical protein